MKIHKMRNSGQKNPRGPFHIPKYVGGWWNEAIFICWWSHIFKKPFFYLFSDIMRTATPLTFQIKVVTYRRLPEFSIFLLSRKFIEVASSQFLLDIFFFKYWFDMAYIGWIMGLNYWWGEGTEGNRRHPPCELIKSINGTLDCVEDNFLRRKKNCFRHLRRRHPDRSGSPMGSKKTCIQNVGLHGEEKIFLAVNVDRQVVVVEFMVALWFRVIFDDGPNTWGSWEEFFLWGEVKAFLYGSINPFLN